MLTQKSLQSKTGGGTTVETMGGYLSLLGDYMQAQPSGWSLEQQQPAWQGTVRCGHKQSESKRGRRERVAREQILRQGEVTRQRICQPTSVDGNMGGGSGKGVTCRGPVVGIWL